MAALKFTKVECRVLVPLCERGKVTHALKAIDSPLVMIISSTIERMCVSPKFDVREDFSNLIKCKYSRIRGARREFKSIVIRFNVAKIDFQVVRRFPISVNGVAGEKSSEGGSPTPSSLLLLFLIVGVSSLS